MYDFVLFLSGVSANFDKEIRKCTLPDLKIKHDECRG